MKTQLTLFSPAIVVMLYATFVSAGCRSQSLAIFAVVGIVVATVAHIREWRNHA